eukprot:6205939-Pleurochrysis_carterae.AAC.1
MEECVMEVLPRPMVFSSACRSSIRLKIFSSLYLMPREDTDSTKNTPTGTAKNTLNRHSLKSTSVGGLASCISGVSAAAPKMMCTTHIVTMKVTNTMRSSSSSALPFNARFAAL